MVLRRLAVGAARHLSAAPAASSSRSQTTVAVPARIQRLLGQHPTTVEGKIKKMLELEKWMAQTGVKLDLKQAKDWALPALHPTTARELEEYERPEDHPAFLQFFNGTPLFNGHSQDRYRNLRLRLGADGPPCRVKYFHDVIDG
jgi:hypothetical protein